MIYDALAFLHLGPITLFDSATGGRHLLISNRSHWPLIYFCRSLNLGTCGWLYDHSSDSTCAGPSSLALVAGYMITLQIALRCSIMFSTMTMTVGTTLLQSKNAKEISLLVGQIIIWFQS
eukprot:TRINITY_DN125985_c0_g1_i1.p1 TRINITY_DN125985_c0_g1~~TRINITY_DN125985_c0_g1_i1.p1  ORF type:complete len:120 (+),score=7.03 TRINITY_DN125985_c0_g1_i1:435-794(+)